MSRPSIHSAALALLFVCGLAGAGLPQAADAAQRKAKTQSTAKVKFGKDSSESTRERERRLLRECKGRPNAGACEGFAN